MLTSIGTTPKIIFTTNENKSDFVYLFLRINKENHAKSAWFKKALALNRIFQK